MQRQALRDALGKDAADRPSSLLAAGKMKCLNLKVERITCSLFHSLMCSVFYKISLAPRALIDFLGNRIF